MTLDVSVDRDNFSFLILGVEFGKGIRMQRGERNISAKLPFGILISTA